MTSKIRVLDEHTINKIAAGEVIENPSSVVKELVENAIDAKATDVTIEIKGGGRQLIRISDNGHGMSADDAVLCLERHATSKIREVEDIHTLLTMGFRGEAVPSIASISKFTIITKQEHDALGTMVLVDGGKLLQVTPAACNKGTVIEVKSLFFNIPVRKKFQKSPNHDTNDILKMVGLLALAHPEIRFQLISNEKTLLETHPATHEKFANLLGQRIEEVLGAEYMVGTAPVSLSKQEFELTAYFGQPTFTRPNKTGQYLFINRRGIQSPFLAYMVRESYGTALSPNRYPIFVLHLSIPGSLVDVNVHPQKKEVRLRQDEMLKQLIQEAVQTILGKEEFSNYSPWMAPESFAKETSSPDFSFPAFDPTEKFKLPEINEAIFKEEKTLQAKKTLAASSSALMVTKPLVLEPAPLLPKLIGTIPGYLLVEPGEINPQHDGLYFIQQKQAHSRILFEKLEKNLTEKIELQTLLLPQTIHLNQEELFILQESMELLKRTGIHLHQTGPLQMTLEAIPQALGNVDLDAFIRDLIHQWKHQPHSQSFEMQFIRQIALTAGRSAISSTKKLSHEEAASLLKQLFSCKNSSMCPLGHPIMVHLSLNEIQKKFSKL